MNNNRQALKGRNCKLSRVNMVLIILGIGASAPIGRKTTFMASIAAIMAASRSLGALPSGFMADRWGYESVFVAGAGIALLGGVMVVIAMIQSRAAANCSRQDNSKIIKIREIIGQRLPLRSFSVQCLVTIFSYFGLGVIIAFLPLLVTETIGASATQVGILFTINGLAATALSLPMGAIADRVGKKKTMISGLIVLVIAMLTMSQANSFAWFVAAIIGNSLGFSLFSPAALALVSSSVPAHMQSTAMGLYGGACENSGIILGSAISGFVWAAFGGELTFIMGAGVSLLGALVGLFLLKETPACEEIALN